ncbi:hypothetical protein J7J55_00605, partial [Candidatus Bipolaricaulota bacterium]|nr:hypothetical protein [Candidatus Bipolaricaulota bacterium]
LVMWSGDLRDMAGGLAEKGVPSSQAAAALKPVINSIAVMFSFMLTIYLGMYINGYAIVMEKMKRSLESLLCTPVGLQGIWLGKTLAVFAPSAALGVAITFLGLFGMNAAVIEPKLGIYVMPTGAPLLAVLVGVPAVAFPFTLLFIESQLVLKERHSQWVNTILFGLIFGLVPVLPKSLRLPPSSWGFVGVLLGIAAVLTMLSAFFARFLTPERVVLSSKGG